MGGRMKIGMSATLESYSSTTIWDVWEVKGCTGFTLNQFINKMREQYKVKVSNTTTVEYNLTYFFET